MNEPLEVALLDRQRGVRVDPAPLRDLLRRAWTAIDAGERPGRPSVTLCLVSDRRMRGLNRQFRGKDRPTDVLSFPDGESAPDGETPLGDIVVSVETAGRQAAERGVPLADELRTLTLHGFLHLLGYDHETDDGEMMRLQARLERELMSDGVRR